MLIRMYHVTITRTTKASSNAMDHDRPGRNTEEYKAVISHYADISSAIQEPTCFAGHLLQAQLINLDVHTNACNTSFEHSRRVAKLLSCVLSRIELSVNNFYVFTEVLEKDPLLSGFSHQMKLEMKYPKDLSTLLSQYGISDDKVEQVCDDEVLIQVSQYMNDDYIAVGSCLNISSEKVHNISQSEKGDVEKKMKILWTWKRKRGSAATFKELIKAFLRMEDHLVAESILKYLSKRRLLLPQTETFHLAPGRSENRYPNWKSLTDIEQDAVRHQLIEDNCNVRLAYAAFVAELIQSFVKRKVDPKVIHSTVRSYSALNNVQHEPLVLDFRRDDSVSDVFDELTKHSTWFNYELIQVLVKILGNEPEKKCLKEYEDSSLVPYLQRSIFEIPCAPLHKQSQRTNVHFKVSADLTITGQKVKAIQRNLAKLLGFRSSAVLHFHDYNDGCIELVFSLPTVILEESSSESKLLTYIKWDKSSISYKIDIDLVTVLSYSKKAEVSLLIELLQQKEYVFKELFEREKLRQKTETDDMQLCEPNNVVQSSLSKPYIEDPIDHQPVYHMESFSSSDCIKGKSDYDLEDQSPSKQQYVYNPAYNVLCEYTEKIVSSNMEPPDIAKRLFSKGVLNEQLFKEITDRYTHETKRECLDKVMNYVTSAVKHNENAFVTFVQAMVDLNIISVNKLAVKLLHNYDQKGGELAFRLSVKPVYEEHLIPGSDLLEYTDVIKKRYRGLQTEQLEWPSEVFMPHFQKIRCISEENKSDYYYSLQTQNLGSIPREDIDEHATNVRATLINAADIIDNDHLHAIITGVPGIGKTTLCHKLCYLWAENEIQDYELLLYVTLRDKEVQHAKNLEDLCRFVYKSPNVDAVAKWFTNKSGQNLMFVFDGWDELDQSAKQYSFVGEIINRKALANASVIVTSHSFAPLLLPKTDMVVKHVELLGYTMSEIVDCVNRTLSKQPELAENLIKELQIRPDVQSLCYIPHTCFIVIFVYRKLGTLPNTLTELYEKFVIYTVQRELKSTIREIIYITNTSDSLLAGHMGFNEICHFAYSNLVEETSKMAISNKQVGHYLHNAYEDKFLGLITRLTLYDDHVYQFLDQTIQEFLAAWWISHQDNTVELFDKYYGKKHFHMCLTFVAGLTGLKDVRHYHHFTKEPPLNVTCIRQPHFGFSAYRHDSFHKNRSVYFIFDSNGVDKSHCHDVSNQPEFIDVFTLQLLYESQNHKLCETFTNSIKSSFCSRRLRPNRLIPYDMLCLKFFLCQSNCSWDHLDLRAFGGSQLSLLFDGFSRLKLDDKCNIRILELDLYSRHDPVDVDSLTKMFCSPISCTLTECYISTRTNTLEDLPKFVNLLKSLLNLKNLEVIQFSATWVESARNYYPKTIGKSAFQDLEGLFKSSSLNELLIQILVNCEVSVELFTYDLILLVNSIISGTAISTSMKSFSLYLIDKSSHKKGEYPLISNKAISNLLNDSQTLKNLSFHFPDRLLRSFEISKVKASLASLKIAQEPRQLKKCLPGVVKDLHCLIRHGVVSNDEIMQLNFIHPNLQVLAVTLDNKDSAGMLFTCLQTNITLKALRVRFHKDVLSFQDVCNAFEAMLCHNQTINCLEIDHTLFKTVSSIYLTHLIRGLQHNSGIQQLRTPIPLPMRDLNTLFVDKKDITHLHLELKRSVDKVEVKGDIFIDHTIPLLKDLIERNSGLHTLKLSGSAIEERPKYRNSENPIVQSFWQTVLRQPTLKFLIMKPTSLLKYNLLLVKGTQETVLSPAVCPIIDWIA